MYVTKYRNPCLLAIVFFIAPLTYAEPTDIQEQKQRVVELMEQESQRLSLSPATRALIVDPTPAPTLKPNLNLNLHAMYGVGSRVLAEVNVNGNTYLYLKGQTWPVGDDSGASQLRLLSMSSRCVLLAHKEAKHNLCLLPLGGQP